jgi:murein DD-endopeptidase MepM/ murein hydrolase activator NlpD
VVYERLVSALGEIRFGRVLAANIETAGSENPAYVLTDAEGRNAYYDAEGKSLRRAFLRNPVKFRRISSSFSRARFHPVLKTTRPHLGTDYSARPGTPIEATGDGTVVRAGRWGGYGIMVGIRHPKGIETRYAHMQGVGAGIHSGVRVRQGQVIGYVGMTGVANGPHVHYEFLKNGRHVNPRRADLGDGEPVPAARRAEFETVRAGFDRLLGRQPSPSVAKVD